MVKFGKTKIANKKFYAAKKTIKIWDVNIDNTVISKLVKTKTNSKYLIGYLDKDIGPSVLIIPKMSRYVKTSKVEDKNNNKIEGLKNIELNGLPVYDDRYIKTKIRTYGNKVYTNFCGLNVPEDDKECEFFYSNF